MPFILISFHLSYLLKGPFPAFQTVCFKKIFLGASPQTPKLHFNHCETNILSIAILEKSLQIKIYPRGGAYIYIDVPSEEALPPCPRYAQAPLIVETRRSHFSNIKEKCFCGSSLFTVLMNFNQGFFLSTRLFTLSLNCSPRFLRPRDFQETARKHP